MRLCPHCGTQNSPEQAVCVRCGKPLAPLETTIAGYVPPPNQGRFRGTMIGLAPPELAPALAPTPVPPGALQAVTAGAQNTGPAAALVPPTPPAPARSHGLRQTMVGIAPPGPLDQAARFAPESPSAGPGQAATGGYPTPPAPPDPGLPAAQHTRSGPSGTKMMSAQKTMVGIALPGIAPTNPGQTKEAPASSLLAGPTNSYLGPPPAQATQGSGALPAPGASGDDVPLPQKKPGIPALAAMAMVGAAGLFAAALVVWLFYHGHGAIEAHATTAANGSEQLELTCAACEDGTLLRLDSASARFAAHHATLPLTRPLKVGANPMTITLVSTRAKQNLVEISVPIAFRVRGDTAGLEAPTPELRVLVDAVPGSSATVDGKPVVLNAQGDGMYAIDVSAELTGLNPTVKPLERRVPYVVTPPNSPAQSGTVSLRAGITPLVIDAPGAAVVLEGSNFVLAGRTAKAGALNVGDRPIAVDPTGRFAQMMNVSAPGETTIIIRASSKESAPRLFPLRVRRVDSLARESERVRQRASSNYAAIADEPESKHGLAVALDGSVVDARSENYNTVLVMDVQSGCSHAPCLARVLYGAPFALARGDKLSAFGELDGEVDGPRTGTRIPEIRADFLIKASK